MTVLRGAGATDVGRVRQMNEDRYLVADGLFAVADGVGGHQAGEVASQTSVDTLATAFTERTADGLVQAIQDANRAVWQLAQEHAEQRGMGTTITVLALVEVDGEELLAVANVGDSRGYLLQRGELVQVTEDHSLVGELMREGQLTPAEAQVHPQRSIITRALGMQAEIEVDVWTLTPYAGDRVLLCSDGLSNEVGVDRIAAILRQLTDPQDAAHELVRQARSNGGSDNITVVIVDVEDDGGKAEAASEALAHEPAPAPAADPAPAAAPATSKAAPPADETAERGGWAPSVTTTALRQRPEMPPSRQAKGPRPRRFTWRVALFVVLILAVLGVAVGTITWYGRGEYFVTLTANQVSIYKGRPGGFLWFDPTLVDKTPLTTQQVPASRLDELREGKEEPTKADADRYVNNLRQQGIREQIDASTTTVPPAPATTTPPTTTNSTAARATPP